MAGILNSKERIIDFIMTEEGKRQASSGQMKIEFASFTDRHTFYEASSSAGSGDPIGLPGVAEDASSRVFFEASNRYQDVIVPELEGGDSLRPFRTSDFIFSGKSIASGTFNTGFAQRVNIITGSKITQDSQRSLQGITNNFKDQQILGTSDPFSDTSDFKVSTHTGSFEISHNSMFEKTSTGTVSLEGLPSLFADKRFGHMPNFLYLPPVNKLQPGSSESVPLGVYPKLNKTEILTLQDLEEHLSGKQSVTVNFSDTSKDNNIIAQLFEFDSTGVDKLSIIDFGEFGDNDPFSPGKRVFFVGKVKKDGNGSQTFMNIFTVVFD